MFLLFFKRLKQFIYNNYQKVIQDFTIFLIIILLLPFITLFNNYELFIYNMFYYISHFTKVRKITLYFDVIKY